MVDTTHLVAKFIGLYHMFNNAIFVQLVTGSFSLWIRKLLVLLDKKIEKCSFGKEIGMARAIAASGMCLMYSSKAVVS